MLNFLPTIIRNQTQILKVVFWITCLDKMLHVFSFSGGFEVLMNNPSKVYIKRSSCFAQTATS